MKRILFADDEPRLLEGLRRMLRGARPQWNMEFVSSGPEALERMSKHAFDVIVTDMRMPGMDGSKLLEEAMTRYPETVRVILSGQCNRDAILAAIGAAHQFLMKPCDAADLRATIERACRLQDRLGCERLKRHVSCVTSLPSAASSHAELLAALSEDGSIERAAEVVTRDIGMAAKLLQLVSSGFFGAPQRAVAPARAAQLLGIESCRSLAQHGRVFRAAETDNLGEFCRELAAHSVAVADAAREIAKAESCPAETATLAFVAGLLHDVGMLVAADYLVQSGDQRSPRLSLDREDPWGCGHTRSKAFHAEIGSYLLGLWGLPDAVVDAAAFHHEPGLSADTVFSPLAAVHVAEALLDESAENDPREALDAIYLGRIGCCGRIDAWQDICRRACLEGITR